jgi:hypothetical protein
LIGDQPARAGIVLFRLRDAEQRERLIRAIPKESPQLRDLVATAVAEEVKDPAEQQRLLHLLK